MAATTLKAQAISESSHTVRRQGGSSTNWATAGTSNYTEAGVLIQCGVVSIGASITGYSGHYYANGTVTFPTSFSQNPIVTASIQSYAGMNAFVEIGNISTTGCSFQIISIDNTPGAVPFGWIAIGKA